MHHHHHAEITHVTRNRLVLGSARQLVLLAPSTTAIPGWFENVRTDRARFEDLLRGAQTLRAAVYLRDGAIRQEQLTDGRHSQAADNSGWHLLVLDSAGGVCGCARYHEYPNHATFSDLNVARSALAACPEWGSRLRSSVEGELALARRLSLPYVELGGWALEEQIRGTTEAIRMALFTYGLSQELGGGVGVSTATFRNSSASILRRIGGLTLEHATRELPPYHDPHYGCQMEILRFYSWAPNPRFRPWIEGLKTTLSKVLIVTNGRADLKWNFRRTQPARETWRSTTVSADNSRSVVV